MLGGWQYFQEGQRIHLEAVWPPTMPTAPQTLAVPWLPSQSGVTCSFTLLAHALMALTGACVVRASTSLTQASSQPRGRLWESVCRGTSLDIMKVFKWCWAADDFNWCAHSMSMSHWEDPVWPAFLIITSPSKRPEQPFSVLPDFTFPSSRKKAKLCEQTVLWERDSCLWSFNCYCTLAMNKWLHVECRLDFLINYHKDWIVKIYLLRLSNCSASPPIAGRGNEERSPGLQQRALPPFPGLHRRVWATGVI